VGTHRRGDSGGTHCRGFRTDLIARMSSRDNSRRVWRETARRACARTHNHIITQLHNHTQTNTHTHAPMNQQRGKQPSEPTEEANECTGKGNEYTTTQTPSKWEPRLCFASLCFASARAAGGFRVEQTNPQGSGTDERANKQTETTNKDTNTHVHTRTHAHAHRHAHAHTHAHTHTPTHAHALTDSHTHAHTPTHAVACLLERADGGRAARLLEREPAQRQRGRLCVCLFVCLLACGCGLKRKQTSDREK
jgi:hypothetical protein